MALRKKYKMMSTKFLVTLGLAGIFLSCTSNAQDKQGKIDRKAVVQRHSVVNTKVDPLSSVTVGNGKFAFTVDITGLQTFPEEYAKGVTLGTQSEWGWHSFPNVNNYRIEEAMRNYMLNGKERPYTVQLKGDNPRGKGATDYFRENQHRLFLANIGLDIVKKDGSPLSTSDLQNIRQVLDMYSGEIRSQFSVEGVPVEVITYGHHEHDAIAASVKSPLLKNGRLKIRIRYPFPTATWGDEGVFWKNEDRHTTTLENANSGAVITHTLDTTTYYTGISWNGKASVKEKSPHYFVIEPGESESFSFSCSFTPVKSEVPSIDFASTQQSSVEGWEKFWLSGAAVDFSGSTDTAAFELERRIILSQYLTRVQCAGNFPPQETGLTYNSWFGKPHLEMHWWHGVHFPLWGRPELLEKTIDWYFKVADNARKIAQRQGYKGLRWQKMTDHDGNESPSSVGAFLIWQQPHFITYAELLYRSYKHDSVIQKYKDLVFETADFMASFAHYDSATKRYILGPGVIPAQERFKAVETFNPTYELAYWRWALETAQTWRKRAGLEEVKEWNDVLNALSPLPVQNGIYLATESATDSYTNPEFKTDHPSVLGTFGMLPYTKGLDTAIMRATFDTVWKAWSWKDTWGWDFPMTAMTAVRLNKPQYAVDAMLMPIQTNTYLVNGHNYQDDRLRLYLPGNGGVLIAAALMLAGYDGNTVPMPGIPKNGKWKVRWEGLQPMP